MPAALPTSAQAGATSSDKEENPELARFRAEWLEELNRRKATLAPSSSSTVVPNAIAKNNLEEVSTPAASSSPKAQTFPSRPQKTTIAGASSQKTLPSHPAVQNGVIIQPAGLPASSIQMRALAVYRRAIEHEQKSELDDALRLYRQAFRMDDNVDRVYRREEMLKSVLLDQQEILKPKSVEVDELATKFQESVAIKPTSAKVGPSVVTGTLASIIQQFLTTPLTFEPENENQPAPLNELPEELIVLILSNLDPTSVERFARVSKKARVLSVDPGIWRKFVHRTYQPPQVPNFETLSLVIEGLFWDFRRVYIEQPRIRLDGVYIATCHYVRPGLNENSWVNTTHLITYHRYLRFYPNGQVLSLLANEEHSPQQVIPILRPTLRMNGFFIGQWRLDGTAVHITNLMDASGRFALPTHSDIGVFDSPGPPYMAVPSSDSGEHSRYVFLMTLELRSRPLGKWNRMDIQAYESLNIGSGDINPILLKHERPFWFSKVRSYSLL